MPSSTRSWQISKSKDPWFLGCKGGTDLTPSASIHGTRKIMVLIKPVVCYRWKEGFIFAHVFEHMVEDGQGGALAEVDLVGGAGLLDHRQRKLVVLSVDVHGDDLKGEKQGDRQPRIRGWWTGMGYLAVVRQGEGSGEEGVASEEAEELALVGGGGHDVPGVLGGNLPQLPHALGLPRVHARLQDVLGQGVALQRLALSSSYGMPLRKGPKENRAAGGGAAMGETEKLGGRGHLGCGGEGASDGHGEGEEKREGVMERGDESDKAAAEGCRVAVQEEGAKEEGEHLWPRSYGLIDKASLTDLHNLHPADVNGRDVVACLNEAMERQGLNMRVTTLVNDTVATLAGARYWDDDVMIAVILGTGTNACYIEHTDVIPKLQGPKPSSGRMIINIEWGAFSNSLPLTEFDRDMDSASINPREQSLENRLAAMQMATT
ncbi:hypothetical protein Taro_014871 [Colocasia esculenta]|uniref:Phosphotransferase n=1 Tax=Colocasia esculenta TaxID=4460 RepID=A0A843UJX5_COLES|nr:hypothetical protein [Colocasia esculenta]